jgi:hypothetical protein
MLCETSAVEALSAVSFWVIKVDIVRGDYHGLAFVRTTTNSARALIHLPDSEYPKVHVKAFVVSLLGRPRMFVLPPGLPKFAQSRRRDNT